MPLCIVDTEEEQQACASFESNSEQDTRPASAENMQDPSSSSSTSNQQNVDETVPKTTYLEQIESNSDDICTYSSTDVTVVQKDPEFYKEYFENNDVRIF